MCLQLMRMKFIDPRVTRWLNSTMNAGNNVEYVSEPMVVGLWYLQTNLNVECL